MVGGTRLAWRWFIVIALMALAGRSVHGQQFADVTETGEPTFDRQDVLSEIVGLQISGPTDVFEIQSTQFTALLELADGTVIDVTTEASWRGEPEEFTAFLIPGSLITGDVLPGEHAARVRASYEGLDAVLDILVLSQDAGEDAPPSITILEPEAIDSYGTGEDTVELRGIVEGGTEDMTVTWSNGRDGSGTASGTREWATGPIPLVVGNNNISITATCADGSTDVARLKVVRVRLLGVPGTSDPASENAPLADGRNTSRSSGRTPYPCGAAGLVPALLFGWLSGWRCLHRQRYR